MNRPFVYRCAPGRWIVSAPAEDSDEFTEVAEFPTQREAFDLAHLRATQERSRHWWATYPVTFIRYGATQ